MSVYVIGPTHPAANIEHDWTGHSDVYDLTKSESISATFCPVPAELYSKVGLA